MTAPSGTPYVAGIAMTGDAYTQAQGSVSAVVLRTIAAAVRRFGIPLSDRQRAQFAQRVYPTVMGGRIQSYNLAVRYMQGSAQAAHVPLPDPAPQRGYSPDAIVSVLERHVQPLSNPDYRPASAPKAPARSGIGSVTDASRSRATVVVRPAATGVESPTVTVVQRPAEPDDEPSVSVHVLDQVTREKAKRSKVQITVDNADDPAVQDQFGQNVGADLARHAHQAGRDAVMDTANAHGREIGWARVLTGAENCAFCSMLASRGPVYHSDLTASFRAHTHCDCRAELVFRDKPWEGRADYERLEQLWVQSTRNASGNAALKAFGTALDPDRASSRSSAASPGPARVDAPETKAQAAARLLPGLEKSLSNLIAAGRGEDSAPVTWHRQQIARLRKDLRAN